MTKINFYRQARNDGGIRSGIDVDGEAAFSLYEPGGGDLDPSLQWYVDIEWSGASLPQEPEGVRALLLAQEPVVRDACAALADRLAVGIDAEAAPFNQIFDPQLPGVQAGIFCSAARRVSGRQMKANLLVVGESWPRLLRRLEAISVGAV